MAPLTREALQQEIHNLVRKYSNQDDVTLDDTTPIDQLSVDSIDLMEITFRLEESHGVEIDILALGKVEVLGDIVDLAVSKLGQGA